MHPEPCLVSQKILFIRRTVPSRGEQTSGMASHRTAAADRAGRVVGLRQIDGATRPSMQDRLLGRRRAVGRREVLRTLEK
jgi:hypothetical protein